MRAVVNAKEFSKALEKVSKALGKSKYIPALKEAMVRFSGGRCVLTGTDMNTWLTVEIPAQGDDFAFVFYRTANIAKACRRFDEELTLELTETGEGRKRQLRLCMSCGNRVGEFHALFPEEYPTMPELEPEHSFSANASSLMERINRIKYATLKPSEDTRACCTSIQFSGSRIYCLDGLRAAWSIRQKFIGRNIYLLLKFRGNGAVQIIRHGLRQTGDEMHRAVRDVYIPLAKVYRYILFAEKLQMLQWRGRDHERLRYGQCLIRTPGRPKSIQAVDPAAAELNAGAALPMNF